MIDMEQRYLRGQVEAINLIDRKLQEKIKSEDFNPEEDFDFVIWDVQDDANNWLENRPYISETLYPDLDWTEQALQWIEEGFIPDYQSYLEQKNELEEIKKKIIYSKEENDGMEFFKNFPL